MTPVAPARPAGDEAGDDAAKGAHLLLGEPGAAEGVTQIAHHRRPLLLIAEEAADVQLGLQMLEQPQQLRLSAGRVSGGITTWSAGVASVAVNHS